MDQFQIKASWQTCTHGYTKQQTNFAESLLLKIREYTDKIL